jgi:hypothetical protein
LSQGPRIPFILTDEDKEESISTSQFLHLVGNPLCLSISMRYSHDTESNAFAISKISHKEEILLDKQAFDKSTMCISYKVIDMWS